MNVRELIEKNEWTRHSPSLLDAKTNKPILTCLICGMPKAQKVHDPECWLGLVLELIEAEKASSLIHIGWYNPGERRFCYEDVKETSPEHHTHYTVPVFAHLDSSVDKLHRRIRELKTQLEGQDDTVTEVIFQLKQRIHAILQWMVEDMKHKHNETHGNIKPGSEGGYTPELTAAIEFLTELEADVLH